MQVMFSSAAKRRLAEVSPFVAAALLTAAVFLLPAVGASHQVQPLMAGKAELSTIPATFQ